jgi:hypothetical protein
MYADTQVTDGRFACRFRPRSRWSGVISASVELRADLRQPETVQALIGIRGERLAYCDVMGSDYAQVFVVDTVTLT